MTGASVNGRPSPVAPSQEWRSERVSDALADGLVASLTCADAVALGEIFDANGDVAHEIRRPGTEDGGRASAMSLLCHAAYCIAWRTSSTVIRIPRIVG